MSTIKIYLHMTRALSRKLIKSSKSSLVNIIKKMKSLIKKSKKSFLTGLKVRCNSKVKKKILIGLTSFLTILTIK